MLKKVLVILPIIMSCLVVNATTFKCIEAETNKIHFVDTNGNRLFEQVSSSNVLIGVNAFSETLGGALHIQWNPQNNPALKGDLVMFFLRTNGTSGLRRFPSEGTNPLYLDSQCVNIK